MTDQPQPPPGYRRLNIGSAEPRRVRSREAIPESLDAGHWAIRDYRTDPDGWTHMEIALWRDLNETDLWALNAEQWGERVNLHVQRRGTTEAQSIRQRIGNARSRAADATRTARQHSETWAEIADLQDKLRELEAAGS